MNAVDPIKSLEDIRKMKEFLAKKPRNALLFSFGINSGLRISDILALNVGDVRGKEYIEIRELKTGKRKIFPINDRLKQEIEEFTNRMPEEQVFRPVAPVKLQLKYFSPRLSCNFVQEKGQKCKNLDANLYIQKQPLLGCVFEIFYLFPIQKSQIDITCVL